jgi:hypothetical protein
LGNDRGGNLLRILSASVAARICTDRGWNVCGQAKVDCADLARRGGGAIYSESCYPLLGIML